MKVEVTKKDIKNGERRSSTHCPIALAIRRNPRATQGLVSVGSFFASALGNLYKLPKEAQDFVDSFDKGREVYPQTFVLRKER